jgi:hypothetical protein
MVATFVLLLTQVPNVLGERFIVLPIQTDEEAPTVGLGLTVKT